MKRFLPGTFATTLVILVAVYALAKWGIPTFSRVVTGLPFPLPTPGTLMLFYMTLAVVALFLLVSFSDEGFADFLHPMRRLLGGGYGRMALAVALVAFPALAGWLVYDATVPRALAPAALRIQHPSSSFPVAYEKRVNPFDHLTEADVAAFTEQALAGEVVFDPQVAPDIEAWADETSPDHVLEFFPTPAMQQLVAEIAAGAISPETGRAALMEKNLFEGRALYAINCRTCHGDSVAGDGPMADGFKLRPINFTDNGTIETIVTGYTFWRVENGGPGLPTEATPWDSAMPEWKLSLTEEQRWKIILAEYSLARKTPRIPEGQ